MGAPVVLETELSRSDRDRRLRGRFDDALWRFGPEPNRPVIGILAYLVLRYAGEQRAQLRSFLEETLAAR